jgi:hypothetical protein
VPQNLKNEFIAGYTFNTKCNQNVCPRYPQRFDPNTLDEEKLLFLNLDHFESFCNYLLQVGFNNKFKLLTHNSDRDFNMEMLNTIRPFVSKIYAINSTSSDKIIKKIPLGFNDQSTELLDTFSFDFEEKSELVYVNFKLHHHFDRPKCLDYFKQQSWSTIENSLIPQNDFYLKLKNFKYCICPRGTGIDTHRIYESLLFGVIPIVKKNELVDLYEKFPVVLVNDWSEVTKEFLEDNYQENLKSYFSWQEKNKKWYEPNFWLD